MSMLTAQCDKLRETAANLRVHSTFVGFGGVVNRDHMVFDAARQMEDAADTIESLRGQLTEQTCINVADPPEEGFWPMPHFKCFVCGAYYVTDKYVYFCPSCGRKVVI